MSYLYCGYCGKHTHTIQNCPHTSQGQSNRLHMYCGYCGDNKHNIAACPKTFSGNADRTWNEDKIKDDFIKD